jgi:type IV pilus assembly protein PilA
MFKRLMKEEKGFTLMEIVIVIVILGILALLAIPRLLGFTEQAEIANDKEYAAVVARAAELYWASHDEPAAVALTDIDMTDGAQLVDDADDAIQYNDGTYTSVGISITDGVATVTITYSPGVTLVFSTSGGYTLTGM